MAFTFPKLIFTVNGGVLLTCFTRGMGNLLGMLFFTMKRGLDDLLGRLFTMNSSTEGPIGMDLLFFTFTKTNSEVVV